MRTMNWAITSSINATMICKADALIASEEEEEAEA
jgi:hypothetical protein